ncbi:hypothetical protein IMCC3317_30710 [Kordia antarctica]|uniref:Phenylalanyl-tRNA synthetase subunit alpha n=1 Tax=Kordia antarctica TaxID=1218801 RepID=A0A7L4ZMF1_9FLAO|nr:hypothetical protein [Kordia antarctica]QHI37690.1 hypothetical protein IMCC3317_30710 [Kordia antarctica]
MKKDIEILEIKDVYVAIVRQWNTEYEFHDWNAFIINDKDVDLEMVLIVSKGSDETRKTPIMRHKLEKLPAKSCAKIEFMPENLLELSNEFLVTFFENNRMFDKKFVFEKNTINENVIAEVPLMTDKGVLGK